MISDKVQSTEEQPCPACGHLLDAVSPVNPEDDEEAMVEGDISICIGCGSFLEVGANLRYVIPSEAFLKELDDSTMGELRDIQRLIRSANVSGYAC